MQHERVLSVPVRTSGYHVDTLGAPFKVVINNGVTFGVDPETGKETVTIKDTVGLINAVVRSRVAHPRKLSGDEIKFVRKALGVRSKTLAEFLDMTPEHFSRCESGAKAMSIQSEKQFRMTAYLASFLKEPTAIFVRNTPVAPEKPSKQELKGAFEFFRWFQSLKIEVLHDVGEELVFEFSRKHELDEDEDDDGDWSGCDLLAA